MAPRPDVYIPSGPTGSSGKIMGVNKYVFIGAAVIGAYVAYRYFKSKSSTPSVPTVTGPACTDGSTPDPITGLCQNGLYPGQTTPYPGQAGTPGSTGGGTTGGGTSGGGTGGPPTTTPPPTTGGNGTWVFLINPDLCGGGYNGCWLYRTPAGADGSCSSGGQPNPYHPGSGYCFSSSSSDGSNPPTAQAAQSGQSPLSTTQPGTSITDAMAGHQQGGPADFRSALLGAQTDGSMTNGENIVTPASSPGLPDVTAGHGVSIGTLDSTHLYLASQNAALRPPPPTGARNWFGPPGPPQKPGPHFKPGDQPPVRPPAGFPPLPKPGNVPAGVS